MKPHKLHEDACMGDTQDDLDDTQFQPKLQDGSHFPRSMHYAGINSMRRQECLAQFESILFGKESAVTPSCPLV